MSDLFPPDITADDAAALDELAAAGVGEGDFGEAHWVPVGLVELYEVLEWENAVADRDGDDLPHPEIGLPPPNAPGVEHSTPLVSRADWGARKPKSVTRRDLHRNTAHYGGPSPWPGSADRSTPARFAATTDHARCPTICRAYQAYHMDQRGWQDIAYSSLVCPHRTRYEGRGKDVRTAANGTTAGNDASHATCYIAGEGDPLPDGTKEAYLDESTRLDGLDAVHSDWKSTACPGEPVRRWVKAGLPAPTTPPPPPPTPVQEDDDMTILRFSAPGRPERLWMDGVVHGWSDNDDRVKVIKGLTDAGYKVANAGSLSEKGYDSLTRSAHSAGDDKAVQDRLAQIALYEAAQLEVETREEQRDLAPDQG
jgi:hypothetical protein